MDTTDEEDAASSTMLLPETEDDFSPLLTSTMIVPEPAAKRTEDQDMEVHFHFGFREDLSNDARCTPPMEDLEESRTRVSWTGNGKTYNNFR